MQFSFALVAFLAVPRLVAAAPVLHESHPLSLVARGSGACTKGGPEGDECYGKGFTLCNKMCVNAMACAMAMGMCLQTQYKACHCDGKK